MKVVILCGGRGTRLNEETEFRPKPLVLVGDMPILWHIMKFYSTYGFNEFVLCLGYKAHMIKEYFLNFEELTNDFTINLRSKETRIEFTDESILEDWKLSFINTGLETQTGGRVARIRRHIGDDEDFFLTYGDGLSNVNLNDLYAYHKEKDAILTLTGVHPPSFFGIVSHKNGYVTSFKEKPTLANAVNGGFFVCNRRIFDYLSSDESCVLETDPMFNLVKERRLAIFDHGDFWHPMDTQKHSNSLNAIWHSGNAPWKIW